MMNLFKGGIYMDKESYNKLKEIEDELSFIVLDNGLMFGDELGDIWNQLFTYLEKIEADD
jgi:hypothetical protein